MVFEEFRQVGTAVKKVEGTGLGLTQCREFVELRKRAPAQEHLITATTMYREMGMTYWLEKAEAELSQFA
jgi:K+-sensing histidine kinase KdpD